MKTEKKQEEEKKIAKAVVRYVRISPRKLRLVIGTVRWKPVYQAMGILGALKNKGARITEKLLKSAMANAKIKGLEEERLYVAEIFADGAPTYKRFRPRSMGRADQILKRCSHLSLKLTEGAKKHKRPGHLVAEEEAAQPKSKQKEKKTAAAKG